MISVCDLFQNINTTIPCAPRYIVNIGNPSLNSSSFYSQSICTETVTVEWQEGFPVTFFVTAELKESVKEGAPQSL